MGIQHLDHLVLTVADIQATINFYEMLGMEARMFGDERWALHFGTQKINLHEVGTAISPVANRPTAGSADLCFLVSTTMDELLGLLQYHDVEVAQGPVERTGATGPINSIYVYDPDGNLIELSIPMY